MSDMGSESDIEPRCINVTEVPIADWAIRPLFRRGSPQPLFSIRAEGPFFKSLAPLVDKFPADFLYDGAALQVSNWVYSVS